HLSRLYIAQRSRQAVTLFQRPVRILGAGGFHRQLPLPPHQVVVEQVFVGLLERGHSSHSLTLHQSLLRRSKISLHSPFCLGRMCCNPGDSQFLQRTADLRRRHLHRVFVH